MTPGRAEVLDTSLREGTRAERVPLTLDAKLDCLKKLAELGFDYNEAG
jgi:isopropylmalate/homocitrate/citramalate synthase